MNRALVMETTFTCLHENTHGQGRNSQVTGDRDNDRQGTVLVADVVLDYHAGMHIGHLLSGGGSKIKEIYISSARLG